MSTDTSCASGGSRCGCGVRPGTGNGPPLVLANGIGVPLEVLDPFVDALDPSIEVVRFDAPGVGGSPDAARAVLRTRRWPTCWAGCSTSWATRTVDMLGISWGGGLAQQFAFQNPVRCRRLVLVATGTGSLMVPGRPNVLRHMLTPRRHQDPVYAREVAGAHLRRQHALDPRTRLAAAGAGAGRQQPRLRLPAAGHGRLDEPAVAAA